MISLTMSTQHKVLLKLFLIIDLTFVFEGCGFSLSLLSKYQ